MDSERRARFVAYFEGRRFRGDRRKLREATGLSEGRISQIFDPDQPFGEKAARNLAVSLGLQPDAFQRPTTEELSDPHDTGGSVPIRIDARKVSPPVREWDRLMTGVLDREFLTEVPDASMAPEVPRGATVFFVTDVEPEPGDFVLVADRGGAHYLREFKSRAPGRFEAHAVNPAFLPMDSERDGLRVVAVFNGVLGRRSRRM